MICVSIGRGRHQQMIAEHGRLVNEGIPLVELRLDFIRREVNIKRLLASRPGPGDRDLPSRGGRRAVERDGGTAVDAVASCDRGGSRLHGPGVRHCQQDPSTSVGPSES